MRPYQAILVLGTLRDSHEGPLYRNGARLITDDIETVLDVYTQWVALALDLGYLSPETLLRDGKRLFADLAKGDVLSVNNAFANLGHQVRLNSTTGFKAQCTLISPHLFGIIRNDVRKLGEGDVYAAKRLLQLFSYTSRLTLHHIDLTEECLADYMSIENSLDPLLPRGIIRELNLIITKWFEGFDMSDFEPKHGPGSVAFCKKDLETKYRGLSYDSLLHYAVPGCYFESLGNGSILSYLDRISETIFVPKSYKTFRTISMESPTLQFYQQGVLNAIDKMVDRNSFLRNHVGTRDQNRNKGLAKEGSISRIYATLDLSAASDSVSWDLVKQLFRNTPIFRLLFATRSPRTVLPDGRLVELKKFAPMGSALCFPVQTLIYASIAYFVSREHSVPLDFSVYGDDIIVRTECVEDVAYYLDMFGFTLNRDKSFSDPTCWFRESCGGEYVDGFDITPLRVSRRFNHIFPDVSTAANEDMANRCREWGFPTLRRMYLERIFRSTRIPFFSPTSLVSSTYSNVHARRRWNPDLYVIEVEVTNSTAMYEVRDDSVAYGHWLRSTHLREKVIEPFISETGCARIEQTRVWRQKPFEEFDTFFYNAFLPSSLPKTIRDQESEDSNQTLIRSSFS